jgi:hypothetical protein
MLSQRVEMLAVIYVFSICVYVFSICVVATICLCLLTRSNQIPASPCPSSSSSSLRALRQSQEDCCDHQQMD